MLQELLDMSLIDMFIIAFKLMLVTTVSGFIFFTCVSILGIMVFKVTKSFSQNQIN